MAPVCLDRVRDLGPGLPIPPRVLPLLLALLPSGAAAFTAQCPDGFTEVNGTCLYACTSSLSLGAVAKNTRKGIAVDDTTFKGCADKFPYLWPHTNEPVATLRLFTAWKTEWDPSLRLASWDHLLRWTRANNAKILVGTQVSCNKTADVQDWEWVKELLQLLTPAHVMGLAVGNELELLFLKDPKYLTPGCITGLWEGGQYLEQLHHRVAELDGLPGFEGKALPVTAVFGGLSFGGEPFIDTSDSGVNTFLKEVWKTYGTRFTFTFNLYPYFSTAWSNDFWTFCDTACDGAVRKATTYTADSDLVQTIVTARGKMEALTGNPDAALWIGEIGWSTPRSDTLSTNMMECKQFSAEATFYDYYKGFLSWDMSAANVRPPDHAFYFTMRDSNNFGVEEHFGLIGTCNDTICKLSKDSMDRREDGCADGIGGLLLVICLTLVCCCCVVGGIGSAYLTHRRRRGYGNRKGIDSDDEEDEEDELED